MTYEPQDSRGVSSRSRWLTPKPRHYRSLGGSIDAFIALIALVGGGGMLVTRGDVRVGVPLLAFAVCAAREAYLDYLAGNSGSLGDLYRDRQSRRASRSEGPPLASVAVSPAKRVVYLAVGVPLLLVGLLAVSHGVIYGGASVAFGGGVFIFCAVRGTPF